MIVTDTKYRIKKHRTKEGEIKQGFYMDGFLAENLSGVPSHLKKDWDVVGIVSGSGKVRVAKCLGGETKVKIVDTSGDIIYSKPLKEYNDGDILRTLSWDFAKSKEVPSESTIIKKKDKIKLYSVELENGKVLRCSMDHKLFVKRPFYGTNDEKIYKIVELKLRDIKIGDELVCEKR